MQNKPNWPPGRDTPAFHYSIVPPFQPDADCTNKAKPGHPGISGEWDAGRQANAPNKPNLRAGDLEDKCRADKELRPMRCASSPGKTKPIRPGGGYQGSGFSGPRPGARTPGQSYKQTQFSGHGRDGRGTHGRDAHATERLTASLRTGLLRQTKPISGGIKRGTSAVRTRSCDQWDARAASEKQSQFGRSCRFEVCRGRSLCLPCSKATTSGQPQGVAPTGSCRMQFETSNFLRL